jgi:F0F1-type ATP synthase assembly protein I
MDFRFKYRRHKPAREELQREAKEVKDSTLRARQLALGLSIPFSLLSGPVGGYFLGHWMDERFNTSYWMPVMIMLGLATGFKMVFDQINALNRPHG